jgi:hypothetical protein
MFRKSLGLLVFAVSLTHELPGRAADVTSTTVGSGVWTNGAIWDTPLFPNNGNGGLTYDVVVAGSNVEVDQPITIENLQFQNGAIFGDKVLTVDSLQWQGGVIAMGATVSAGGGALAGASGNYLDGLLKLQGLVNWQQGNIAPFSMIPSPGRLEIEDGGELLISGAANRTATLAALTVDEGGTLRNTATGSTYVTTPVTNHGSIVNDSGLLQMDRLNNFGTAVVNAGQVEVARLLGDGDFELGAGAVVVVSTELSGNFTGSGSGVVHLLGGAITGPTSIMGVTTQVGGNPVAGPGDLTIERIHWGDHGGFTVNHPPMANPPGLVRILGGTINGSGGHYIDRKVQIEGLVDWQAGNIQPAAYIPSTGSLDVKDGGELLISGAANRTATLAALTVDEGGTLRKTGLGTTYFSSSDSVVNNGSIICEGGTLTMYRLDNLGIVIAASGQIEAYDPQHVNSVSITQSGFDGQTPPAPATYQYDGYELAAGVWQVEDGHISFATQITGQKLIRNAAHIIVSGSGDFGPLNSTSGIDNLLVNAGTLEVIGDGAVNLANFQHSGHQSELSNPGTLRVRGDGVVSGNTIRSTGHIEGNGRIEARVVLESGTVAADGVLHVEDLESVAGTNFVSGGTLAGRVTIGSRDETPVATRLRFGPGTAIDGELRFSHGELEIDDELFVTKLERVDSAGPNLGDWFRPGTGEIISGDLHVAAPVILGGGGFGGGAIRIGESATIHAAAGVLSGSFSGRGTIRGNVTPGAAMWFSGDPELTIDGNFLSASAHTHRIASGTMRVTGATQIANGGTLELSTGSAATLRAQGGLTLSNSTFAGKGAVHGNVTAVGATFDLSGPTTLHNSLTIAGGDNVITGDALTVTGPTNLDGGKLTIAADATLNGAGKLVLNNGQVEILGTFAKAIQASGNFIVGGYSASEVELNGAEVDASAGAGFGLLNCFEDNEIQTGSIQVNGNIVVNPGTLVIGAGAYVSSTQDLLILQDAALIADGTVQSNGSAVISGTVAINTAGHYIAPTAKFAAGSKANVSGKVSAPGGIVSAGQVAINTGAVVEADTMELEALGELSGGGALPATAVSVGTLAGLSPGNSPGAFTMKQLTMEGGAYIEFEIRNAAGVSGVDYDRINVIEAFTLDADPLAPLRIDVLSLDSLNDSGLAGGFNKYRDYQWTIATAASILGFDAADFEIDLDGFLNAYAGAFSVAHVGNELRLVYTAHPIPGDFDGNDRVEANDLITWRASVGLNASADADGDGDSDGSDFLIWQRHLGVNAFDIPAAMAAATSVPEPQGIVVIAMLALGLVSTGRRSS